MRAGAAAALLAAAGAARGDTARRHFLPTAKCVDGSPAAYYIANTSSTKYIIYLEGGGLCRSLAECKQRAGGHLGSSKGYAATQPAAPFGEGMLSGDAAANPDFASWNRVFVRYCSGDVWKGRMTDAVNPWGAAAADTSDAWTGYFSGHRVVAEVVSALRSRHGAASATDVVLSGCSAGGVGTFVNCDYVAAAFPGANVACRPEAGYFDLPISAYADWAKGRDSADMRHSADANWTKRVRPYEPSSAVAACNAATGGGRRIAYCDDPDGCCSGIPYFYPYTATPMFISQNTMDAYQVEEQGGGQKSDVGYIKYLHDILAGSLTAQVIDGPKRSTDGLFAPGCLLHCPMPWSGPTSSVPRVDGKTHMQAFGDWYFRRGAGPHMHLDNNTDPRIYAAAACTTSP